MRQDLVDDDLVARSYAVTHPSGAVVLPHGPGWDQLLYAASGVMRAETGDEVWTVPPHRALWLPNGAGARVLMHGRVAVRTLYLRTSGRLPDHLLTLDVPPLLRELVLHAVRHCPLERARGEHRALLADPAQPVPLDRLAAGVGASRRTLERLFLAETGMTIGQWRGRLRLVRAVEQLAAGQPVTAVAGALGYATPSAFSAMFRAQLGEPPRRYLDRR
jgi:AraC-like DNA-binding protein